MDIRELLKKSNEGDGEATSELIKFFTPLINRYSYLFGKKDEDLSSELMLAFIKCVKRFKLDERMYAEGFNMIQSKGGS